MTLQTSFQAVQLTRYGTQTNPQDLRGDPDEPLCGPHARTIYELLFEYQTSRIESYYIPTHSRLNHFLRIVPSIHPDPEPYHNLLGATLVEALPAHIEISRVNVDMQPTGTTPALTHRLLSTTTSTGLSSWTYGSIEGSLSPLSKLLKQLTTNTRPYILKVVARKIAADDLEVALWLVDYTPPTNWQSPSDETPTQREQPPLSIRSCFAGPHLTTKIEVPDAYDDTYWADLVRRHDDIGWYETTQQRYRMGRPSQYDIELLRSSDEFPVAQHGGLPQDSPTESLHRRGEFEPWVGIDSEQLPAFSGLLAAYYPESPWIHTPDRSPPTVEPDGYYQRV